MLVYIVLCWQALNTLVRSLHIGIHWKYFDHCWEGSYTLELHWHTLASLPYDENTLGMSCTLKICCYTLYYIGKPFIYWEGPCTLISIEKIMCCAGRTPTHWKYIGKIPTYHKCVIQMLYYLISFLFAEKILIYWKYRVLHCLGSFSLDICWHIKGQAFYTLKIHWEVLYMWKIIY